MEGQNFKHVDLFDFTSKKIKRNGRQAKACVSASVSAH